MLQRKGSIYRITCVVSTTTLKYTVPTVHRVSLFFRKLNNKVIFNYLITNKSYLFISLMYLSFVCDPIGFYNVDNNIKSHI